MPLTVKPIVTTFTVTEMPDHKGTTLMPGHFTFMVEGELLGRKFKFLVHGEPPPAMPSGPGITVNLPTNWPKTSREMAIAGLKSHGFEIATD